MTVLERIKILCRERKNISITTLEQTLGYSNGSLSKAKDIPSSRIAEIAKFLDISVDYLMTGKEFEFTVTIEGTFTYDGHEYNNDKLTFVLNMP